MDSMSAECCYLCNECPSSFSSLAALEQHLEVHVGSKQGDQQHLEDHDMNQHSPSSSDVSEGISHEGSQDDIDIDDSMIDLKPGYTCRFCHSSFENQSQLNIHYTHTHRDKPQYKCDVCHTVFAVKRELSTHMRIHSGEQPHRCTQCSKEFGTRQLLKKHWMWHTGERTHVCKHCNKAFFQKGHLTQHLMIHSGGRPHKCQLCQKTFIFKFDLNRHMKIHAERGFACGQCGRSFQRQVSLDEHSLKCKGKTQPQETTPPLRPEPAANNGLFPLLNQTMLNFTQEQMAKMAQNLLAQQQQRALNALLAPTPVAPSPASLYCVLCSKHFNSQQLFALHMYTTHVHQNGNNKEDVENTVTTPMMTPMNPIKTDEEDEPLINVHSETATNSSCASSPQKPSPVCSESFCIDVTTKKESDICSTCDLYRNQSEDLQHQLRQKSDELDKYKEMMKTVVSTAGQLLSQCQPDNVFILHTKNMFNQLQTSLLTSE